MGFRCGCGRGNGYCDKGFDEPNGEPCARGGLPRRDEGGCERGDAHRDATPSGYGGEFRRALHGFADVFKMVCRASIDGDRFALGGAERTGGWHGKTLTQNRRSVKYFVSQSTPGHSCLMAASGSGRG